jgi:hypothetical protein
MTEKKINSKVEKLLKQSKSMFKTIDKLDRDIHGFDGKPDKETVLKWARQAAGAGDYLLKKYKKLRAMKLNEEMNKYHDLKRKADTKNQKFISTVADRESSYHVRKLRLARDIFEGYVDSAKNIISICRMHNYDDVDKSLNAHL